MAINNIRDSQSNVAFPPDEEKKPKKEVGQKNFGSNLTVGQENISDKPKPFTFSTNEELRKTEEDQKQQVIDKLNEKKQLIDELNKPFKDGQISDAN